MMNSSEVNKEKEEQIRTSYRNYYKAFKRLVNRKTKRIARISITLLFISLILLTIYGILINKENTIISRVFLESLLIGGWVFAWEAVHLLFIDIAEPFRKKRELERFLEADITFSYLY